MRRYEFIRFFVNLWFRNPESRQLNFFVDLIHG